jgi:hypothetical protein
MAVTLRGAVHPRSLRLSKRLDLRLHGLKELRT